MASGIRLILPPQADASIQAIADLFTREVARHGGPTVTCDGSAAGTVVRLEVRPELGSEAYALQDGAQGELLVAGGDARGLLYGLGRLLREARMAPENFAPGIWRGRSAPNKPVRGIYLATHFHNYYHDAPVAEVERYVEELALWGYNVVSVWFDQHHYRGIDDPAAQAMIARLHAILGAAKRIGLGGSLTLLANEAYADSPVALRADWTAGHDGYHHPPMGHYHLELCPSLPGAPELLLRWVDEKLEAFADLEPDYLWIWPYDQGGCTCARCAPWGANGFLRMAEPIARRFRARCPSGQVVLSTWYFDHFIDGEWEGLAHAFSQRPDWVDYLLADDYGDRFPAYPLEHGAPGGLPLIGFPEISMYTASPWGGYGANPLPHHLQGLWEAPKHVLAGGFPYSEGIYEDLNKAICAQLYWDADQPCAETVRAYLTYELGPAAAEPMLAAVEIMERTLARGIRRTEQGYRFPLACTDGVDECWRLAQEAQRLLPATLHTSWRWRVLYLRALIDYELAHHDFETSERCEQAFQELTAIYHAEGASLWVAPPTRAALAAKREAQYLDV